MPYRSASGLGRPLTRILLTITRNLIGGAPRTSALRFELAERRRVPSAVPAWLRIRVGNGHRASARSTVFPVTGVDLSRPDARDVRSSSPESADDSAPGSALRHCDADRPAEPARLSADHCPCQCAPPPVRSATRAIFRPCFASTSLPPGASSSTFMPARTGTGGAKPRTRCLPLTPRVSPPTIDAMVELHNERFDHDRRGQIPFFMMEFPRSNAARIRSTTPLAQPPDLPTPSRSRALLTTKKPERRGARQLRGFSADRTATRFFAPAGPAVLLGCFSKLGSRTYVSLQSYWRAKSLFLLGAQKALPAVNQKVVASFAAKPPSRQNPEQDAVPQFKEVEPSRRRRPRRREERGL